MRVSVVFALLLSSVVTSAWQQPSATSPDTGRAPLMTVDGTVTDAKRNPIADAQVVITDKAGRVVSQTTTDIHGNYRVILPRTSAEYTVTARSANSKDSQTRYFDYPKPGPADDGANEIREYVVNLTFGGTRLTGANEFDIFFVTSRARANLPGVFYNAIPATNQGVSYGVATMRVPRRHHSVRLETPAMRQVDTSAPYTQRTESGVLTSTEFFSRLQTPKVNLGSRVLIYVHGFDVTFEDALHQTAQLTADLGFRGQVILYSWPSSSTQLPMGLRPDLAYERARKNLDDGRLEVGLMKLLESVRKEGRQSTIFVLAHSMGTDLTMRAIRPGSVHVDELMFAAPDIAQTSFDVDGPALAKYSGRFTIYFNNKDRALAASKSVNLGYPRQGIKQCGPSSEPPDCIDASDLRTGFWRHSYHLDTDSIVTDILQITCRQLGIDRRGLEAVTPPHLWRARRVAAAIPKECIYKQWPPKGTP